MLSCSIWFSEPSFWMGGARHHPHRTHNLRSGSQDHHPSKNSVQKTICCNSTSNAPDDGRMYPKHVELRRHQNCLIASSWNFTLFHEEDARSNNPQDGSLFLQRTKLRIHPRDDTTLSQNFGHNHTVTPRYMPEDGRSQLLSFECLKKSHWSHLPNFPCLV